MSNHIHRCGAPMTRSRMPLVLRSLRIIFPRLAYWRCSRCGGRSLARR
ncbi:MAG: hypothetical protein AVDCRST_MAG68-1688 [uncultured Gemmatimonadetes bacterium]|uniref:Uncharacterized protein n=1 Tax=uncultured Gemmatimonadota bacterium TaxID=203437 RepID=A0A6J4K2N5_9BACT|nr:MAG: hypothetical protein AVDCRST_MAG68-1688 [uncultured Gemmatimonadota bacterium]